jgi:peptide/nickel transport system substrate-binding protein
MSDPAHIQAQRPLRLVGVAIVVVLAMAAAACGSSSKTTSATKTTTAAATEVAAPSKGGSLTVGIPVETPGFNPSTDEWDDTGNLEGSTMLEPLATAGADSGAKPWLATSWIANTTFTRWVIKLRPGVTFQDGTPFNAAAVVQNMHTYLQSPFYTLTISSLFSDVSALDNLTVQVDLTQPWAAFPSSYLDSTSTYMMAPSMIAAGAAGSKHPVGTGPFVFSSWVQNNALTVNRNPHYWGGLDGSGKVQQGTPYLDSITFRVITDDQTRSEALQSGDIDMLSTISAATANSLAGSFNEVKDWDAGSVFVQPNTVATVNGKPNPMANIHARMALAYATDAKAITALAGKGLNLATSPFGPNTPWGMPASQNGYVSYNLAQAKAQVAQYKAETGDTSLTITLMGLPNLDVVTALQALSAQWAKAGITTHIQTLDQSARITAVVTGNYEVTYTNNYGYPDPDNEYYFWSSSSIKPPPSISINFAHYGTPQIDKDLNTGRQSGYVNVRKQAYDDLVKQLNAGFTHIWLYYTPFTYVAAKKVQGLDSPTGPGHIPFGNFDPKTWWGQVSVTK